MTATAVVAARATQEDAPQALVRRGKLSELAARLEHIRETTRDVVADTAQVRLGITDPPQWGGEVSLNVPKLDLAPLTRFAHGQLAEKVGVPFPYYQRMQKEAPELLVENVNHWLAQQPERRLFRMAEGRIRAVLSDRYRPGLDNYGLAFAVAERAEQHHAEILQCDLSETHMQVRIGVPNAREKIGEMTAELRARYAGNHIIGRGNVMDLDADYAVPGLLVSNSEVGAGAFKVEGYVMRLVCWNGLVMERGLYKVHIGAKLELGEFTFREDTRQTADELTWKQVRDVIDSTFDGTFLHAQVEKLLGAKKVAIAEPVEVVDATAKYLALSKDRRESLLRYFSAEGETLFGLVNGVTRLAQDFADPDQQTDFERAAGAILATPSLVGIEA